VSCHGAQHLPAPFARNRAQRRGRREGRSQRRTAGRHQRGTADRRQLVDSLPSVFGAGCQPSTTVGRRVAAHTSPVYVRLRRRVDDDQPRGPSAISGPWSRVPANTYATPRSGGPTSSRPTITGRPTTSPGWSGRSPRPLARTGRARARPRVSESVATRAEALSTRRLFAEAFRGGFSRRLFAEAFHEAFTEAFHGRLSRGPFTGVFSRGSFTGAFPRLYNRCR